MSSRSARSLLRDRPRLARVLAGSLLGFAAIALTTTSCGSRTGLFAPELGSATDAGPTGPDASPDGAVPCLPGEFAFDLALTQLMFVIDRSGSMRFPLNGTQPATNPALMRWRVLQEGLRRSITTFDQEIAMGAKFFPEVVGRNAGGAEACQTDTAAGIAPARGNAARILSVFDQTEPAGGTPTSEAIRIAAQVLAGSRSVARTIVVATDGAPNCNGSLVGDTCTCTSFPPQGGNPCLRREPGVFGCLDGNRTIETIRTIADVQRIPVYVIGIGSLETPEFLGILDQMAVAGGRPRPTTPRHYNVQSEAALNEALATIRDAVAKCTYLTPSSPRDPNAITVEVNGEVIARDQTKQNGWDWVDQTFGELAFFGDACTKAQGSSASVVSGTISCNDDAGTP